MPISSATTYPNLYTYVFEGAREATPALFYEDQVFAYGDLISVIENTANSLQHMGIQPGNRIGILAENSPFWVASYFGCIKLGATAVPLPLRLTATQLTNTVSVLDCAAFCVDAPRLSKYLKALPLDKPILTTDPARITDARIFTPTPGSSCATVPVIEAETLAALMFTSGSTGQPNAVKVSHRNIRANTESIISYLDLTPEDRILTVLPFDYCFGTSLLHTHLRAGGSLVLQNSFLFLEDVLTQLEQSQCTGLAGVPATFQHLLRRSSFAKRQFSQLRKVQQAGGRLPVAFINEFIQAQPQAKLFIMYGQTEATARLSYLPPDCLQTKAGSIGKGIPGVTLRVINEDGLPVQPGEVGEVVAEGENITLGYWTADPNKTPFRDGKLYTGDLARVDEDGFIFIVDRVSDFIKPMGHRISSREIEEVLAELANVIECAVIGMPDEMAGESAVAFIVPLDKDEFSEQAVTDLCRRKLPSYAVPQKIVIRRDLPKNAAGKVLKKELKAQLQAELELGRPSR